MKIVVYQLDVANPIDFLRRLLDVLEVDAYISFEGDLSAGKTVEFENALYKPFGKLRRNTIWSSTKHNYLIVPLTETNRRKVRDSYLDLVGIASRVWHIEVIENGKFVLGAYDNFGHGCTALRQEAGEGLQIDKMISDGVISEAEIVEVETTDRRLTWRWS